MIWSRIITALILIPIVVAIIVFVPPLPFQILAVVLFSGMAWEWANLCEGSTRRKAALFTLVFALSMMGLLLFPQWALTWVLGLGLALWVVLLGCVFSYKGSAPFILRQPLLSGVIGLVILCVACFSLIQIRFQENGPQWILALLVIVWACDTAAYFTGRAFGKRPFSPLISPNKTWAGFWGGALGGLGVSLIIFWLMGERFSQISQYALVMLVMVFLAIYGDLFESLIKRIAKKKDSGAILPGHGGLLDRMDSMLPTLPWFAAYLMWLR